MGTEVALGRGLSILVIEKHVPKLTVNVPQEYLTDILQVKKEIFNKVLIELWDLGPESRKLKFPRDECLLFSGLCKEKNVGRYSSGAGILNLIVDLQNTENPRCYVIK